MFFLVLKPQCTARLKTAQARPLFKKKNILEKGNYRPVSVLPTISKFVERAIFDQLTDFFNFHFHPSLSAFRKGFGCQTALLKIIEDWKTGKKLWMKTNI